VVTKEKTGKTMSLEVLEKVFSRIDEYLRANPQETINLTWHGGEPLLLGADYFHQAHDLLMTRCGQTADRVNHMLQTNATQFTGDFVEAFRKFNIGFVGTSFEPEPGIRGGGPSIDSETYNREFLRGVSLMERYGIQWGVIYVVTKKALDRPLDAFYFLANLSPPRQSMVMNPVLIYGDKNKDLAITPREYAEFLGTIFPVYWQHRNRFPSIRTFENLIDWSQMGIPENNEGTHVAQCVWNEINIGPDGETHQCGRASDWDLMPFGSIFDRTLEEILNDPSRQQLSDRLDHLLKTECKDCRFWTTCSGGCPLDAWDEHKDYQRKSPWCESHSIFIEKYFEPITGIRFEPGNASHDFS
jgi:uncharacterized protein